MTANVSPTIASGRSNAIVGDAAILTLCAVCRQAICSHPDPIYAGVVSLPGEMARAELAFMRRESDSFPAAPCHTSGGAVHRRPAALSGEG